MDPTSAEHDSAFVGSMKLPKEKQMSKKNKHQKFEEMENEGLNMEHEGQVQDPPEVEPTIEEIEAQVAAELQAEDEAKAPLEQPISPEMQKLTEAAPANLGGVAPTKVDRNPDRLKKSTIPNPVKMVFFIAEEMLKADPTVRRKDIVAECVKQGIALYTSRTQVQVFLSARKSDLEFAKKILTA